MREEQAEIGELLIVLSSKRSVNNMKKLLLTGFEAFLNHPVNPTEWIVNELNGKNVGDVEIIGKVLPVDFHKSGTELMKWIKKYNPDAVISLGLAAGRSKITPERIAINCNDGPADNLDHNPYGEKVFENGPDGYFSRLPIYEMVDALHEAGLPAKISNTAGTYLCNNVMYHGLHYVKQHYFNIPLGFIHIPASYELALESHVPSWSQDDLLKGVKLIISCL